MAGRSVDADVANGRHCMVPREDFVKVKSSTATGSSPESGGTLDANTEHEVVFAIHQNNLDALEVSLCRIYAADLSFDSRNPAVSRYELYRNLPILSPMTSGVRMPACFVTCQDHGIGPKHAGQSVVPAMDDVRRGRDRHRE
jgi:hypothetical protein